MSRKKRNYERADQTRKINDEINGKILKQVLKAEWPSIAIMEEWKKETVPLQISPSLTQIKWYKIRNRSESVRRTNERKSNTNQHTQIPCSIIIHNFPARILRYENWSQLFQICLNGLVIPINFPWNFNEKSSDKFAHSLVCDLCVCVCVGVASAICFVFLYSYQFTIILKSNRNGNEKKKTVVPTADFECNGRNKISETNPDFHMRTFFDYLCVSW